MTILFVRTILVYAIVFAALRLMGKREIGKLSLNDLVISIMIAEIAVFVLEDVSKPFVDGVLPIATLAVLQIGLSLASLRSRGLRMVLEGQPSYLIRNGRIDREEMRKQRYSLDDLIMQLRQNKVVNVADVEFAILETSGKLTVLEKKDAGKENESKTAGSGIRFEGLPLALILDGKVQDAHLEKIGKNRFWLKGVLRSEGVNEFQDVFFCTIDHRGRLFIDRKSK